MEYLSVYKSFEHSFDKGAEDSGALWRRLLVGVVVIKVFETIKLVHIFRSLHNDFLVLDGIKKVLEKQNLLIKRKVKYSYKVYKRLQFGVIQKPEYSDISSGFWVLTWIHFVHVVCAVFHCIHLGCYYYYCS